MTSLAEHECKRALGAFLREMREKRKKSLGDMATALGRSKSYVCDIEAGRRGGSRLPAEVVVVWASYLDIPVAAVAEKQRVLESAKRPEVTSTQRYRSYMKILRNRKRSNRIYTAVSTMRTLLRVSDEQLTPAQVKDLLAKMAENVEVIDSCLVYSR